MKEIIALQEYTDKYISLYEGQIRNVEEGLANKLIEEGFAAEHNKIGNNENNIFIIEGTEIRENEIFGVHYLFNKKFPEVKEAILNKKYVILHIITEDEQIFQDTYYVPTDLVIRKNENNDDFSLLTFYCNNGSIILSEKDINEDGYLIYDLPDGK